MARAFLWVGIAALVVVPCQAQVLGPSVWASQEELCLPASQSRSGESAIVASPNVGGRLLVAWNRSAPGASDSIWYTVSTNGGVTFTCPARLPFPTCLINAVYQTDPMVAASFITSGDMWAGGYINAAFPQTGQPMFIAKVPGGQTAAQPGAAFPLCDGSPNEDKPWMAVGPCPPQNAPNCTGETMYGAIGPLGSNTGIIRSGDGVPPGTQWPTMLTSVPQHAWGVSLGVLRHAVPPASAPGRVVLAGREQFLVPNVSFSDNGGATWTHNAAFSRDHLNHLIGPVRGQDEPGLPNSQFFALTVTSTALDPHDTKKIVVAFPGRDTEPGADPDNIDAYLAVSVDGAATFVDPNTGVPSVYHISDAQLRLPGESGRSMELMPAVWIDEFGGVDLMIARTDSPPGTALGDASVSIRLARWSSLTALIGTPWLVDMALPFKVPVGFSIGTGGNDFQMLAGSGCYVWGSFTRLSPDLRPAVYVRRIDFCGGDSVADFNRDTVVDLLDQIAFALAYASAAPEADVNRDDTVTPSDAITFQNAYEAARHP